MENFECGKFLGDEPILEVFFQAKIWEVTILLSQLVFILNVKFTE